MRCEARKFTIRAGYLVLKENGQLRSPFPRIARARAILFRGSPQPKKCYLKTIRNRAESWFHAGNHMEPGEEVRTRAYFHARDSDLP